MSDTDLLAAGVSGPDSPDPVDEGMKSRARARHVVNEALLGTGTPLDNRGLRRRLLPGVWNAASNVLIEYCSRDEAVALLADRARSLVGSGDNADAGPRELTGKALSSYAEEVAKAGETVLEQLAEAFEVLEEEEIDEWFPETVLDSALLVLARGWGPDHVRRALSQQAALFVRGVMEPHLFMEPSRLCKPAAPREEVPAAQAAPASRPEAPAVRAEAPAAPRRLSGESRIEATIQADVSDDGTGAWAVHLNCLADEREEERYMFGVRRDPTGRGVWTEALRECVAAILGWTSRANALIAVGSPDIVRAAQGAPGARLSGEDETWAAVDRAAGMHSFVFRHQENPLGTEAGQKCDLRIRHLLARPRDGA